MPDVPGSDAAGAYGPLEAFAEYGRIDKTMHLLGILGPIDDTYHRRLNKQLTVREFRHRLARKICHRGGGQIRQPYPEDQLAAIGLVVNAVALCYPGLEEAVCNGLYATDRDNGDAGVGVPGATGRATWRGADVDGAGP